MSELVHDPNGENNEASALSQEEFSAWCWWRKMEVKGPRVSFMISELLWRHTLNGFVPNDNALANAFETLWTGVWPEGVEFE